MKKPCFVDLNAKSLRTRVLWSSVMGFCLFGFQVGCTTSRQSTGAGPPANGEAVVAPEPSGESEIPTSVAAVPAGAASTAGAASAAGATGEGKAVVAEREAFSTKNDDEIHRVLDLSRNQQWKEAEVIAQRLYQKEQEKVAQDPTYEVDPAVLRVYAWISKQGQILRDQALEDRIREIDSRTSVFSPTLPGIFQEKADRGLPPRKDLRDAVEQIESTPYVPDSFNRTVIRPAPVIDFKSQAGRMARELDRAISVKLDNVTLESIIFHIGEQEGINFVADRALEAFKKKLSINFDQVKLGEFLTYISRNFDLQFQVGDDLIWIVDGKDPNKSIEETRIYRLKHGLIRPAAFGADEVHTTETKKKDGTVTTTTVQTAKSFVRDGASATTSLEKAIQSFFKGTQYQIDYDHNSIIATGTREQLTVLEHIIKEYDRPLQQVLIEARFITVSEGAFLRLGALWESARPAGTGSVPKNFLGFGPDNVGVGLQETFTDVLNRKDLSVTLSALEQEGESQTLSAPRVTLVNNLPATISDGKVQYYYQEYTVTTAVSDNSIASTLVPKGTPQQITSGASLKVMASIGGDGKTIYLALNPEVNQDVKLVRFATVADATGNSFEIRLPESRTQSISTRVVIQSGQTVVMGGVLERSQSTVVESVPVLGKIPIIGAAFRRRTEVDNPRYLLVFVTASLLSDTGEFIEYRKNGGVAEPPLP